MIRFTEEIFRDKEVLHNYIQDFQKELDDLIQFKLVLQSQPNPRFSNEIIFRYYELYKDRHDVKIEYSDRTKDLMLQLVELAILEIGETLTDLQQAFELLEYES